MNGFPPVARRAAIRRAARAVTGLGLWASPVTGQVDADLAATYFDEARALCEREGGRLWGRSLCGPMVFADAATGTIATNRSRPAAPRPALLGFANAAVEWGDARWATYVWPLPPDAPRARGKLMLHELFHRIQPELGFWFPEPRNDHLDTAEGRYWLQLEWRALAEALAASAATEREVAIRDALSFRRARHARFPEAAENERVLELQEGLAEYTGVVTSSESRAEAITVAAEQLGSPEWLSSLVRAFGYGSGSAYGLLLDAFSPGWTRRLDPSDDLASLLMQASGLRPTDEVETAAARYGGETLRLAEAEREARKEAHVAALRRRFVEGPVLALPGTGTYSFMSRGITPIGEHGTVYPQVRSTADWGRLEAAFALISTDRQTLTLPAPTDVRGDTIRGEDWTLHAEPGWVLRPGARPEDLRLVFEPS